MMKNESLNMDSGLPLPMPELGDKYPGAGPMSSDRGRLFQIAPDGARRTAAYEAGRLYNELCWLLDQAVLCGDRRPIAEVANTLGRLVPKFFGAFPVDDGNQFKEVLLKTLEDWNRVADSEWFAEEWATDRHWLDSGLEESAEKAFGGMLRLAKEYKEDVLTAIERVLDPFKELKVAFWLGECVGQGIRPPGASEDVGAACLPGDLPPPIWWAENVRGLWDQSGIPVELPESLFDPAQYPDPPGMNQIIASIDCLAREGFAQAGIASIHSHSQPSSHEEAATESKKVSGDEPKYIFHKNGEIWNLRFTYDGQTESADYPTWKGLEYYALLLKHPGKPFSAIDIIREVDDTVPTVDKEQVQELSRAGDDGPHKVRSEWSKHEAADEDTEREVEEALQGLEQELAVAQKSNIGIERIEELTKEISQAEEYLNGIRGKKKGERRTLKSGDAKENARKSVSKAMGEARKKLSGSMPKLALFLEKKVKGTDYGFRYYPPSPRPDWSF
jgi:hypothetical protein